MCMKVKDTMKALEDAANRLAEFAKSAQTDSQERRENFITQSRTQLERIKTLGNWLDIALRAEEIKALEASSSKKKGWGAKAA